MTSSQISVRFRPQFQIKDGQTLPLGGLSDSNSTDSSRSVPWFESIPSYSKAYVIADY
ncbi:hypothetical protein QO152_11030 [Pantoea allii]|uniref:hypothetical protein n=1 Tax=Pantoea allii TaxID=574096 RepID=UPI003977DE98